VREEKTTARAMTEADYAKARTLLTRRDPVLGQLIKQIGSCGMHTRQRRDHLTALVSAITSQQLSTKAAATIFQRVSSLCPGGELTVEAIVVLEDSALRGAGLSGQKVGYLRDLSARLLDGRLDLDGLDRCEDEEVVTQLTTVRGFGRWTAEMFLMFRLHRPDVLPVGDLGIVKAVQRLYRLRKRPDVKRLQKIGEPWRPYRSVACWYLWQSLGMDVLPAVRVAPLPRATHNRSRSRAGSHAR
jgi:DNA-3-methyladenine glycosylase II